MSDRRCESAELMLLDTYGLVYRAFFALPSLTRKDGMPVNAAYGFTMMLNKLLAEERPTHVIAAFDKGMPAERVALFPAYKAHREAMPDPLRPQFALVREILAVYGIPILEQEGEEADDVIATLARQAEDAGATTVIVTGDLDLLQLVDERTTVVTTRRGISDVVRYDPAAVRERYGLKPSQLADYRGLKGDPSDNLPGIPGIGEKTASKLIAAAGSLDALLAQPALAGTEKLRTLIERYGEQAKICRDVSRIRRDLKVGVDWERAWYTPPSNDALYRLYAEMQFTSLLNKLDPPSDMPLFDRAPRPKGEYRSFVAAVDPPEFVRLAQAITQLAGCERVMLTLDGDGLGMTDRAGSGLAFARSALAQRDVRAACEALWKHPRLAFYDAKRAMHALRDLGFAWRVAGDDAMLAAHLLDPSLTFSSLAQATLQYLQIDPGEDPAAQADAAMQLLDYTRPVLAERDQIRLYEEIEVPLATILGRMEEAGIAVDTGELRSLAGELDASIATLQQRIYDFAGETFNIGSPQQLGHVLFERLQIPGGKKNKTGWATGVEVLQALAAEYPICRLVLDWREVTKLKNTYVEVIPQLVDPRDGRLHTVFNQAATATGRLSSTNPNLQNIPVRGDLGRRIRKAFVAADGAHVLLAADYSQIELRLLAHLSGDAAMRAAFEAGQDIHDFTARQLFALNEAQTATAEQRRMAKIVNFGLLYGMSDFGLAQRLETDRSRAREITAAYFARFPSVRAYLERTLEEGRERGYVTTIMGRRRYVPALRSDVYLVRSSAEREAVNAPLQGSAADLMKLAMVRIARRIDVEHCEATMLLQIHDELIFDVRRDALADVAPMVRSEMEGAMQLSVPLVVTLKSGRDWYDVQPYHG